MSSNVLRSPDGTGPWQSVRSPVVSAAMLVLTVLLLGVAFGAAGGFLLDLAFSHVL